MPMEMNSEMKTHDFLEDHTFMSMGFLQVDILKT